mgnify:CR=1 FL=1
MALPLTYHWRSLFVRRSTTLLTLLVVAAVVGVFAWMLSFASAMRTSVARASDTRKLIVLKRGATAEGNSAIYPDEFNRLSQLTDVALDPATGAPLLAPEMVCQVSLPRLRDRAKTPANVAVRGVTDAAFRVHPSVKVTGRVFSKGEREVIVGVAAAKQFAGLALGDAVNLGYGSNRGFRVVGLFTADGGPMESEIWGYLPSVMDAYNRRMYSSASLRLRPDADPQAVIAKIEGPAIQLTAQTEAQYWRGQTKLIRIYLMIAYVLVAVMCVAAVFSIANTMFSAVAGRTREIAMLRTIGFSCRQIVFGFLLEAVLLALLGAAVGCAACAAWLAFVGNKKDIFGATTFTTMAFEIRVTPAIVGVALLSAAFVGLIGAAVPAVRAGRTRVVTALREA